MTSRRVVITGLGVVTPLGNDLDSTIAGLLEGRRGWTPASRTTTPSLADGPVARVIGLDPRRYFRAPKAIKLTGCATQFAVAAALDALRDGGWPESSADLEALGVVIGSSASDLQVEDLARAIGPDPDRRAAHDIAYFGERILAGLHPLWLLVNLPNMVSAHVAIQCGARGPNNTIMTDWTAGTQAIGEAFDWIRRRDAEGVLAGGADSGVYPFVRAGYEQAGLGERGAGDGFVPGEGAALLLLEERERAIRRGACVWGEVVGYATASAPVDADAISSGGALTDTIDAALREAGWVAADVQRVINASMCDSRFLGIERAAVARTIGSRAGRPCVVEFTSKLGHALGAAGAIDAALGVALASRGADSRDCAILCNALGYSGQAASLAIVAAPGAGVGRLAS